MLVALIPRWESWRFIKMISIPLFTKDITLNLFAVLHKKCCAVFFSSRELTKRITFQKIVRPSITNPNTLFLNLSKKWDLFSHTNRIMTNETQLINQTDMEDTRTNTQSYNIRESKNEKKGFPKEQIQTHLSGNRNTLTTYFCKYLMINRLQ